MYLGGSLTGPSGSEELLPLACINATVKQEADGKTGNRDGVYSV